MFSLLFTSCINDSELGGAQRRNQGTFRKGTAQFLLQQPRAYLGKLDPKMLMYKRLFSHGVLGFLPMSLVGLLNREMFENSRAGSIILKALRGRRKAHIHFYRGKFWAIVIGRCA